MKIKKRYFNYLIFTINDQQTIVRQRIGKGIWQNLYEFPLIESDKDVDLTYIKEHSDFKELLNSVDYEITLFEDECKVHKLSHQHLYTRFYIIKIDKKPEISDELNLVEIQKIHEYPVPILLGNFIDSFFSV